MKNTAVVTTHDGSRRHFHNVTSCGVRGGRSPGVVVTWVDNESQVTEFIPGAIGVLSPFKELSQ